MFDYHKNLTQYKTKFLELLVKFHIDSIVKLKIIIVRVNLEKIKICLQLLKLISLSL